MKRIVRIVVACHHLADDVDGKGEGAFPFVRCSQEEFSAPQPVPIVFEPDPDGHSQSTGVWGIHIVGYEDLQLHANRWFPVLERDFEVLERDPVLAFGVGQNADLANRSVVVGVDLTAYQAFVAETSRLAFWDQGSRVVGQHLVLVVAVVATVWKNPLEHGTLPLVDGRGITTFKNTTFLWYL